MADDYIHILFSFDGFYMVFSMTGSVNRVGLYCGTDTVLWHGIVLKGVIIKLSKGSKSCFLQYSP